MLCDECGEDEWVIDCKACCRRESWCPNCQDACDFDPDGELCSDCFEKAEAEAEAARAEYVRTVEIEVEILGLSEAELAATAVENAIFQKMDYLQRAEDRGELDGIPNDHEYAGSESRAITNFLRHHCTNYDKILAGLPKLKGTRKSVGEDFGEDDARETIRDRVHEAIQKAYPFLYLEFD